MKKYNKFTHANIMAKMFFNSLIVLHTHVNIKYWWNYGSLLLLFLLILIMWKYFTLKDSITVIILLWMLLILIFRNPYFLGDLDNFIEAIPMVISPHIKPEWYFLFAYSIFRSIDSKLGVILLITSILILFILPFYKNYEMKANMFYHMNQLYYWLYIMNFILLTWLGTQVVQRPFILMNNYWMN